MMHAFRVSSLLVRRVFLSGTLALALASVGAGVASADTIRSTIAGGPWHIGSTWVGGSVPASTDDVILEGPVTVHSAESCASLELSVDGSLSNGAITPSALEIAGSAVNRGTIMDGGQILRVRVGGDLDNQGSWSSRETIFIGTSEMHLSQSSTAVFGTKFLRDAGAIGDLVFETPVSIVGDVDLQGGKTILSPDCPLTMLQGLLAGDFLCQGNEIRFESWSYMIHCDLDAAVLIGDVDVAGDVSFTGGVTIMDGLSNSPTFGSSSVTIDGPLINHGVIQNDTYGFTISLSGDLECYGVVRNSFIELEGPGPHHLRMGPLGDVNTLLFLPEFGTGTLVVETDARISDGVSLGLDGTMVLAPGITLDLSGGSLGGGTLWAQGNNIIMNGTGALSLTQADHIVLSGTAQVFDGTGFTSGLQVLGTLQNWEFAPSSITVDGDLINDGLFRDNVATLTVHARGNVINRGTWENRGVVLDGVEDQSVEIGAGIGALDFVLVTDFSSSGYQWYRGDVALPGETSSELVFTPLEVSDVGTYRCEGGEGQVSRTITISQDGAADAPELSATSSLRLAPIRPNPVGAGSPGGAQIEFALPEAGEVRLAVFDVTGREVAALVSGRLAAGGHVETWTPAGTAPGVYFVRLVTPSGTAVRKVALVE